MDDMQIRRYNYLVNTGWLTQNEARKLMDLPQISDADMPAVKIEVGVRDGRDFFMDSLAAIRDISGERED